jgi:energy-coupling factor transporter ATP-binding protein EcfA2
MTLTRIKLERFTAFEKLDIRLSPGINIFIGENGTGKTHLLKVTYAACDITQTKGSLADKLIRAFLPYQDHIGRLVHRTSKSSRAVAEIYRGETKVRSSFSNHSKDPKSARITWKNRWTAKPIVSVYIPVKEMLANAPSFVSLYENRDIHFEEIYRDIIHRAFRPALRGPYDASRRKLMSIIQQGIEGKVIQKGEYLFLKNKQGELEFTLLAEGMRKLALLWLLIQNGTLLDGALVEILLELQRMGVQILLATHDYVLLKEFDLRMKEEDQVRFHALYRDEAGKVAHQSTEEFLEVHPNAISDTFLELYDRDVVRDLQS